MEAEEAVGDLPGGDERLTGLEGITKNFFESHKLTQIPRISQIIRLKPRLARVCKIIKLNN